MKVMQGTVSSAKTPKTAIVTVVRRWQHPLYKKYVKRTKSYACHLEDGMTVVEGDVVTIQECRPVSKTKKFKVVSKTKGKAVALKGEVDKEVITPEVTEPKEKEKTVKKAKPKK